MSVQPKQGLETHVEIYNDPTASSTPEPFTDNIKNTATRMDGVGSLLYHVHSHHFKSFIFAKEETSLQFYEHVVIATQIRRLWCFPKKCVTTVIPRFKIVDAYFTLGPRSIPKLMCLLLAIAIILISLGASNGGCKSCENRSYTDYYGYTQEYFDSGCNSSSGTCAMLVIGSLLLVIPVPLLLLLPCIWKWHYVYLDIKTPSTNKFRFGGGFKTLSFRFKKMGFDHSSDDKAVFDEFYLIDYVYGSFQKSGNDVMSEAHLLSHFNNVSLATPIVPLHADNSIGDILLPALGASRRKKHSKNSHDKEEVAVGTRPSFFTPKCIEV